MMYVLYVLLLIMIYVLGFITGYLRKKYCIDYKQLSKRLSVKLEKYKKVIRTYRNILLLNQSKIILYSSNLRIKRNPDYIKVCAKLELINQIEHDIELEN